jgi:hypothetical protein
MSVYSLVLGIVDIGMKKTLKMIFLEFLLHGAKKRNSQTHLQSGGDMCYSGNTEQER